MERKEALENVLEDLSLTLNEENKRYNVNLTYGSSRPVDDSTVEVNAALTEQAFDKDIGGADELRLLVDDVAQQIERTQITHCDDPTDFMQNRKRAPQLAGLVRMIIEKQYLEAQRTRKYRGMRRTLAYRNELLMEQDDRVSLPELGVSRAYVEGLIQVSLTGYAKGFNRTQEGDLQEFLVWVRGRLATARQTEEIEHRNQIAAEVYDYIIQQTDYKEAEKRVAKADAPVRQLPRVRPEWAGVLHRFIGGYGGISSRVGKWSDEVKTRLGGVLDGDEEAGNIENRFWERTEGFFDWLKTLPVVKQVIQALALVFGTIAAIVYKLYKALRLDKLFGWLRRLLKRFMEILPDLFTLPFSSKDDDADEKQKNNQANQTGGVGGEQGDPTWEEEEEIDELVVVSDSNDESEEAIEQMKLLEDRERTGDWFEVDGDVDYKDASDTLQARYEELATDTLHDIESVHELRDKRNTRIEENDTLIKEFEKEVNEMLVNSSLDREIEDAFKKLTTRDRNVRSRKGRKLDMHAAARRLAGDASQDKLYKQRQRAEVGRRAVAVAVDFSGSMNMDEANLAVKALQHATDVIGDNFLAVSFNGGGVSLITGPNEDYRDEQLAVALAGGGTPVGEGIVGARKLLRDTNQREKVLIVITDGSPNRALPSSEENNPIEVVANEVFKARHNGIKVIGMCVGNNVKHKTMAEMFGGRNVLRADMDNLPEQLVSIYEDQMRI